MPGTSEYDNVFPIATYAPWNVDSDFIATYRTIRSHTLVDIYRCWELWTLVGQSAKAGGALLEVGVWRGGTGALIAKRAALDRPEAAVYLCDTFRGVVKAGRHDNEYKGGEHTDTSVETVQRLTRALHLTNTRLLEGIFPDQTAHLIPPEVRFGFCHIDVDVYQSAKDVVAWIWDRLETGGLIVFDDYGFAGCHGIRQFVNEQREHSDRLVLHNLNGHAVVIKLDHASKAVSA
jgi:O-methyltransferase